MSRSTRKDIIFGIIVLLFGAAYFSMTLNVPAKSGVDARTVPLVLSGIFIVLGVLQLISVAARPASGKDQEKAAALDRKTVAVTAGLILCYVLLLDFLGFIVASSLYLFAQMHVLKPETQKKNYALYAFISIVSSASVYYIFNLCFDLLLPEGLLG